MSNFDYITRKQLQTLVAIVETGNLARAAELLNVTAPAVSIALKTLESQIGAETIRRGKDGKIVLNPIGEELFELAKRLESQFERSAAVIAGLKSGRAGSVAIGVVSTAKYFFPRLVKQLQTAYPDIRIQFYIGNRREIVSLLEREKIVFAIMGRPPSAPAVEFEEIAPHPHVIVAPISFGEVARVEDLAKEVFLVREEGSGTRILFERYISQLPQMPPVQRMALNSNETIKQAVIAGLGVAFLSAATIETEFEHDMLKVLPLPGLPIIRSWYVVWRQENSLSAHEMNIRDYLQSNTHQQVSPILKALERLK